jgi:N-carbamoylputrescine amidase
MTRKLTIGLPQYACGPDPEENIERAEALIRECAEQDCHLICLQELFHTTYFCQEVDPSYFEWAIPQRGEVIERFCKLAKELSVVIILPYFERRTAGIYHNSLLVIEKDGSVAGDYRKTHIPDDPGFYEKYYFTPGDEPYQVISTSVGKIGALICWDQWYPEAARAMTLKGADFLVYPTAIGTLSVETEDEKADFLEAWQTIQRSHAIANGIPVISVNRVGTESGVTFWGHSFVTNAFGKKLVEANESEGVWMVDVDLDQTEHQRQTWPFLRDRRIDLYGGIQKRFDD